MTGSAVLPYTGGMTQDPDDSRPPFQRIAEALREDIQSGKYQAGDSLPSQGALSEAFGVSRATIQNALRALRADELIVGRPGVGTFVRTLPTRSVGLRPHLERCLQQGDVEINFAGYTSETLYGALCEPLDRIRAEGSGPSSLVIRLLLADITDGPIPVTVDPADAGKMVEVRTRSARISGRSTHSLIDNVEELVNLGVLGEGGVEVRRIKTAPTLKMVLVNGADVFWGVYPVRQLAVAVGGEKVELYDAMGKDAVMFHRSTRGDDEESCQQVAAFQDWFDSTWENVADITDD